MEESNEDYMIFSSICSCLSWPARN